MKEQIPLNEYKKGKRNVYVDWTRNFVSWKNECYKLTFINIGGEMCPYVVLSDTKPLSEMKKAIEQANKNKKYIKFSEYEILNNKYFILGIGKIALKVRKNGKEEPEFIKYTSTEGQYILNKIVSDLQLIL